MLVLPNALFSGICAGVDEGSLVVDIIRSEDWALEVGLGK